MKDEKGIDDDGSRKRKLTATAASTSSNNNNNVVGFCSDGDHVCAMYNIGGGAPSSSPDPCDKTTMNDNHPCTSREVSYVEFYSGIGGWTMALRDAFDRFSHAAGATRNNKSFELKRLAALDHSDLCRQVFVHNFGDKNPADTNTRTFSIGHLTLEQVEAWRATIYVMSPPCQPHTRQHTNQDQDLDDPRSASFLHICDLLEGMEESCLPELLFLENVIGFEQSHSFRRWERALGKRGYQVGRFHLNPTQVGFPNDRPRYFCMAVLLRRQHPPDVLDAASSSIGASFRRSLKSYLGPAAWCEGDDDGANGIVIRTDPPQASSSSSSLGPLQIWKAIPELGVHHPTQGSCGSPTERNNSNNRTRHSVPPLPPLSSFLDDRSTSSSSSSASASTKGATAALRVPEKILKGSSAWCFDIVSRSDRRSACFTQSYGRFIRGTGSILYDDDDEHDDDDDDDSSSRRTSSLPQLKLLDPKDREFDVNWWKGLDLSKLFGFSDEFVFPEETSTKQQWKLVGNSLNVGVASRVVELGLWLTFAPPDG
jgi:tRNA (cytosine38-C5)-methyltransferase